MPLQVLFEDEQLLALSKPGQLLVIPDRFDASRPTLFDGAWFHLWKQRGGPEEEALPRLIHRLDQGTSGVIVFAKTYEAQRALSRDFEQGGVQKRYLALVLGAGVIEERIDLPLAPLKKKPGLMTVDPSGKEAATRVVVLERFAGHALVAAYPETGRQHQIRVHLAARGHPLAFDPPYRRAPAEPWLQERCPRLTLHAEELRLRHPQTREELRLTAPIPDDLARALAWLRGGS